MKLKELKNRKIAILGYGSQGKATALNLRDSGCDVIIGLPSKSKSRKIATKDFRNKVFSTAEAAKIADIVCFAFPDHLHGRVYEKEIKNNLEKDSTLWFLHGLSIHFKFIVPPKDSDVILVAPHAPGIAVREKYLSDKSISAFIAVDQDKSRKAKATAIELAAAVGFSKSKLVSTTFKDEAIGDLFGEQAVLCGGMASLIKTGHDILIENGHKSDHAYLEVAYQLDLIIDLIKKYGIEGMYRKISVAAKFGSILNGPKIIDSTVKKKMEKVYKEIDSGKFPKKLNQLSETDIKELNKSIKDQTSKEFEKSSKKFAG